MGKHLKRSHIREAAFLLIFEKLFRDDSCDEIIESAAEADEFDFNDEVKRLFKAVDEKAGELDGIIGEYSEKRKVNRIGKVSLAVLRLAIYGVPVRGRSPRKCCHQRGCSDNEEVRLR